MRKLLKERGVFTDTYMSKTDLAKLLKTNDKSTWEIWAGKPLPKAAAKTPKDIAEISLKAAGMKGFKK